MKVAIVGAGSSGIFAAYKMMQKDDIHIDIFEKGKCIQDRTRKDIMSGFGGAGAFSDGKLTLTTEFGGWLTEYITEEKLKELIKEADEIWKRFSLVSELSSKGNYEKIKDLEYRCSRHRLRLYAAKIRHLGTDNCFVAVKNIYDELTKSNNVGVFCSTEIKDIVVENKTVTGIIMPDGRSLFYDKVILAVGRSGSGWIEKITKKHNLDFEINPVDIGVRVEVPKSVTDEFTQELYEFKIKYFTSVFEDEVRTFCVNPGGFVATERNDNDLLTVNGHSYKHKKSENTNFALLVSTKFTEPFKEPVRYGQYIAYLSNMLSGGGVIIQRFGDLIRGRRSTDKRIAKNFVKPTLKSAMPGDLSFVFPYRYLSNIKESIYQLDKVMPGLADPNTLLYGAEVKFYSLRISVDSNMRSKNLENLYCIGDGAGITRGIIQASASGLIAANDILQNL